MEKERKLCRKEMINLEKSKVYFTDFRAKPGYNLLQKLERLIKKQELKI